MASLRAQRTTRLGATPRLFSVAGFATVHAEEMSVRKMTCALFDTHVLAAHRCCVLATGNSRTGGNGTGTAEAHNAVVATEGGQPALITAGRRRPHSFCITG